MDGRTDGRTDDLQLHRRPVFDDVGGAVEAESVLSIGFRKRSPGRVFGGPSPPEAVAYFFVFFLMSEK